ncbi:MAG: UDP-N-acetylmuramoyl-L-alanine--D-glutamate ligase [Caldilineaceae bacterium SB0668_bin_21]|nr:UDP-N-acetylmuramoyl-L-alanine--D-glutamate ligase [Caldilineaceae bacterium SB0668_bin_21]MYC22306.1 UDP-N-acetylmuramoyl-L-alanine--D-glutamate ligase [Caldilineaceae bacterium SB0662_bin_25]
MIANAEEFNFEKRNVVILGMGRQGLALVRFFVAAGADVTISDVAPAQDLAEELEQLGDLPVTLALGGHPSNLLDGCDLLCLSGGVRLQAPLVQDAIRRGIPLSNDSLLTMQLAPCPIIAITGSSGKTTTTTLVGEMLQATFEDARTVHVGGNIGRPLLDRLGEIQEDDMMVLELSSFQLELFDSEVAYGSLDQMGPDVAAILNVTPNHLDRHPSMADYVLAKSNLLRHLKPASVVVLNADDPVASRMAGWSDAEPVPPEWELDSLLAQCRSVLGKSRRTIPFSTSASRGRRTALHKTETRPAAGAWASETTEDLLFEGRPFCRRPEVRLRGEHNISNLLAAAAVSGAAGASEQAMGRVARSFAGVPHRLEEMRPKDNVVWINDSIATAPERAVAGLQVFPPGAQTLILLAGGKDKNLPWDTFADEVLDRVQCLIGFGEAGSMIADKVRERASFRRISAPCCAVVKRLDEAVVLAKQTATPGTVVLFSPGGTSYDAYKNFEQRGDHFRNLVARG